MTSGSSSMHSTLFWPFAAVGCTGVGTGSFAAGGGVGLEALTAAATAWPTGWGAGVAAAGGLLVMSALSPVLLGRSGGIESVKVEPCPYSLVATRSPPNNRASRRAIGRPRPVPLYFRE